MTIKEMHPTTYLPRNTYSKDASNGRDTPSLVKLPPSISTSMKLMAEARGSFLAINMKPTRNNEYL